MAVWVLRDLVFRRWEVFESRRWDGEVAHAHRFADEVALREIAPDRRDQVRAPISSIPSATTRMFNLCPSAIVARTRARFRSVSPVAKSGQEAPVELQLAGGEASEVRKRGDACAEVIDRDTKSKGSKLGDDVLAELEVADDRRLGDLKDERGWFDVVAGKQIHHRLAETEVEEVGCRDIDGHRQHAVRQLARRRIGQPRARARAQSEIA